MTQEQFESAAVAYLTDQLSGDSTLDAIDYVIRPGRSQETPPGDRSEIVVLCGEVANFRERLKEAMLECFVRSPADIEGVTLATHSALTKALELAWASANYADWSTAVAAVDSLWVGANYYREGWNGGSEGTDWLPSLRVKTGVSLA